MADTLRALDAAVQAHIAENFPGAVTNCQQDYQASTANQLYCTTACRERAKWARMDRVPCAQCGGDTGYKRGFVGTATCNECRRTSHGKVSSYRRGCRCDECRRANTERQREYFKQRNARTAEYPRCVIADCNREARSKNLCPKHYRDERKRLGLWKPSPADHWTAPNRQARAKQRKAILRGANAATSERFTVEDLLKRDGQACSLCGDNIPANTPWPHPLSASIDHITPISKGGAHSMANTKPAHLRCNMIKGARTDAELTKA